MIAVDSLPSAVDPAFLGGTQAFYIQQGLGGTLLNFKDVAPDTTQLVPAAGLVDGVASVQSSDDTGITLKLSNAKSAAGNTLSAADVSWTFQRIGAVKDAVGQFFMFLAGIDAKNPVTMIDDHTVKINTSPHALPLLATVLAYYNFAPIDSKTAQQHVSSSDQWATTWMKTHSARYGQYDITDIQPAQQISYTANQHFSGTKPGYPSIVFRAVADPSVRVQLLQSGQVDVAPNIDYNDAAGLANSSTTKIGRYTVDARSPLILHLNLASSTFADVRVRRAISEAIDRAAIVQGPYRGFGTPNESVVSTLLPGLPASTKSAWASLNVSDAKAQLAAAGKATGISFTVSTTPSDLFGVDGQALLALLQSQLQAVGVDMKINVVASGADFAAAEGKGQYEAATLATGPAFADTTYAMAFEYSKGGFFNAYNVNDSQVNATIGQAQGAPLGPARDQLAAQAVATANDQVLAVPLVLPQRAFAMRKSVCLPIVGGGGDYQPYYYQPC